PGRGRCEAGRGQRGQERGAGEGGRGGLRGVGLRRVHLLPERRRSGAGAGCCAKPSTDCRRLVSGAMPDDAPRLLREWNRGMIAFDLILGSATLLAPRATLKVLGHERPSADAEALFRRCGPIWLTFAAAHAVAAARGKRRDWW